MNTQEEVLRLLKGQKGYLSGAVLAGQMNISRTAVWKAIVRLKEEGYEIESVTNKGYRLIKEGDIINGVEILSGLNTKYMGQTVYCVFEVDSTNNEIRRRALLDAPQGTLVVAQRQTAGKGRLGRTWESPVGSGIFMSLLLRPHMEPKDAPVITLLAGMAVCQAVRRYTGLEAQIKWPNDILINGKKICGILTEMNGEMEKINYIILGIGINVNTEQFPAELEQKATSLKIESKKEFKRAALIQIVLEELERLYELYEEKQKFCFFANEYKQLSATLGKEVHVIAKAPFDGTAVDITPEGELIVLKQNGQRVTVFSGEVSIRTK